MTIDTSHGTTRGATRTEVTAQDPAWTPFPPELVESTVSRVFERQAALRPTAPAIAGPTEVLTYAEVDERANRLASALKSEIDPLGRAIALLADHDVDLVVAVLAVLKAGGIVLVLDPQAPPDINAAIVADAQPAALVADVAHQIQGHELAGAVTLLDIETLIAAGSPTRPMLGTGPGSPAMLAYSSGTTGGAKAAIIPHRALLHLTRGASDTLRLTASDHLPMLFPISMAVAAYPMFLPLLNGGTLHIRDVRSVGLVGFTEWLADEGITVLYLSPTVARFLGPAEQPADLSALRLVVLGGERVDGEALAVVRASFGDRATLANGYGTTETGVLTFHVVDPDATYGPTGVPVGHPIAETELVIVGDDGQPVAPGEVGDLVVKSRHLFSGYWQRPDLDAAVLDIDHQTAVTAYRTGDVGRIDEHGELHLFGRSDTEVKVRGHRVVPGEVELALLSLDEVVDAVVDARPDPMGTNELVAWVVPASGLGLADIRRAAERVIRGPMLPARTVLVDALPVLPNGKLDRRALPDPDLQQARDRQSFVEPRTEVERRVAHIWHRILGVDPLGVEDDLIDLGAQSLDMAWALARIEEDLGIRVPMAAMIDVRTVAQLADVVEETRRPGHRTSNLVQVQAGDPSRPRLFIPHDLHGSAFGLRHVAPLIGLDQPIWGFESPYLEGPEPPYRNLDALALHYVAQLLELQPEGPYHLAGYSFGGVMAFEMARQLRADGHEVAFLAILDVGPGYRGRHYDPDKVLDKPWMRVPMLDDEPRTVSERARWYTDLGRRDPKGLALNLSIRSGADRWLDPLYFRYQLTSSGRIAPGDRLWYSWRKHWELGRRYDWSGRSYDGDATLVWADETASTDGTMGWRSIVSGDLTIEHVSVLHEEFFTPGGAAVLGPLVRRLLDTALDRTSS